MVPPTWRCRTSKIAHPRNPTRKKMNATNAARLYLRRRLRRTCPRDALDEYADRELSRRRRMCLRLTFTTGVASARSYRPGFSAVSLTDRL